MPYLSQKLADWQYVFTKETTEDQSLEHSNTMTSIFDKHDQYFQNLTSDQKQEIYHYTGSEYTAFNESENTSKLIQHKRNTLKQIIENAPDADESKIRVYRGIRNDEKNSKHQMNNGAFISTTTDLDMANYFAGNDCCVYSAEISNHTKKIAVGKNSDCPRENEIILSPDSEFQETICPTEISSKTPKKMVCFEELHGNIETVANSEYLIVDSRFTGSITDLVPQNKKIDQNTSIVGITGTMEIDPIEYIQQQIKSIHQDSLSLYDRISKRNMDISNNNIEIIHDCQKIDNNLDSMQPIDKIDNTKSFIHSIDQFNNIQIMDKNIDSINNIGINVLDEDNDSRWGYFLIPLVTITIPLECCIQ